MKDISSCDTDLEVVFLVGNPLLHQPRREKNIVYLPCPDDYASLPQKTYWFTRWALQEYDFDYLFKCDDDTYVSLPRLMQFSSMESDYVGGDAGGYASGGGGYFLSRRSARSAERLGGHKQGAEDLLVGRVLSEAGVVFTPDRRFHGWFSSDSAPRPTNDSITAHPIRDSLMDQIHLNLLNDPHAATDIKSHCFKISSWSCGFGSIGLDGGRGFNVDGSANVDTPTRLAYWPAYQTVSAHAPSRIDITVDNDVAIFGFIDQAAWDASHAPMTYKLDHRDIGIVSNRQERTSEVRLTRGRHILQTSCEGTITRRYPVWAIRPMGNDQLRIVMPTSNHYVRLVPTVVQLINKYWPGHPPIDVIHHESKPACSDVDRYFFAGLQKEVSWCEAMRRYLETANGDECVLLLLDDYALSGPINDTLVNKAMRAMKDDLSIGAFYLTWMMLPSWSPLPSIPQVVVYPNWTYSVHLQAGIWRRARLLCLLEQVGQATCAAFELAGSDLHNVHHSLFTKHVGFDLADPPHPSLFLDGTDKRHWPIPYHNLIRGGQTDARHAEFLRYEGLDSV